MAKLSSAHKFTEQEIKDIRRKYLFAMAVSLGVPRQRAGQSVDELLNRADSLAKFNYNDHGIYSRTPIENVGYRLLDGSSKQNELKFEAGSKALALLKEDVESEHFFNLKNFIKTVGEKKAKIRFDEILSAD